MDRQNQGERNGGTLGHVKANMAVFLVGGGDLKANAMLLSGRLYDLNVSLPKRADGMEDKQDRWPPLQPWQGVLGSPGVLVNVCAPCYPSCLTFA